MGGDVDQKVVDSASVFLFTMFMNDQNWSRSHAERIKKALGPFPASAASNACNIIKRINSLLPEGLTSKTFIKSDSSSGEQKPRKEFGHKIAFKYNTEPQFLIRKLANESSGCSSGYDSLSDDEQVCSDSLKTELVSGMFEASLPLPHSNPCVGIEISDSPLPGVGKYTGSWLKKECQMCARENVGEHLEWNDLYSAIFEHLSSTGDNSSIENYVCDLKLMYSLGGWTSII